MFAVAMSLFFPASQLLVRAADGDEALIVECIRPCPAVTAAVAAAGGAVTHRFENIDAIAVRVPRSGVSALVLVAGATAVHKDHEAQSPSPPTAVEVQGQAGEPIEPAALGDHPDNYNFNLSFTNVAPLHAAGERGQNIVVAVIDSGTVNVPNVPALSGSVIGGESLVPTSQDPLSATHRENGSHGTMTAEMIAAHSTFLFLSSSPLVRALNRYAPGSAVACSTIPGNCGLPPSIAASAVPMTGTAPAARIYAMKVFAAQVGGAPESRVIAAMDRAVTLRRNYNVTGANAIASGTGTESDPFVYSALKIDVVNMSLGGPTLFAGRDFEDQLTFAMLDAGITLVTSAGNNGPAAMTGGSPGTSPGALTVAAASTSVHERILIDLQFGPGAGEIYRPTTHPQTAYFSSRGPTADGRIDPDVTANGVNSFVQAYMAMTATGGLVDCRAPGALPGSCVPRIVFASGTSFSSPTVAGAAALLRRAHPFHSATEIRNSLHQSANPLALGDDSTQIDQGNGVVDVARAAELLASGGVSADLPDLKAAGHDDADVLGSGGSSVTNNVRKAGLDIAEFTANHYATWIQDLKPGEVRQIFLPSDARTSTFTVTVDRVTPVLPPEQQNQFWLCGPPDMPYLCGDDVYVAIVDAPTSFDVTRASGFPNAREPHTFPIDHPQTGLVRVAVMGDWTNGGNVSALVTVRRERRIDALPTKTADIEQDQIDYVDLDVPAGAGKAVFELSWLQNWGRYPTSDLDLVLIAPEGNIIISGATANSPERVEIGNPAAGRWTAAIIGFTIHGNRGHDVTSTGDSPQKDAYTFLAEVDGRRLKEVR
jgi:subtilisin family serine protease